jgi:hypothetical protein
MTGGSRPLAPGEVTRLLEGAAAWAHMRNARRFTTD